jgi:hypothetical protein
LQEIDAQLEAMKTKATATMVEAEKNTLKKMLCLSLQPNMKLLNITSRT